MSIDYRDQIISLYDSEYINYKDVEGLKSPN